MKNFRSRKSAWEEFRKSESQISTYNEYVDEYNGLRKKFGSRLALSVLSQNRIELDREITRHVVNIEELTNRMYDELTIENTEEGSDLEHLSNTLKFFVGDVDEEGFDVINEPFKEKIQYFIKQFCEEKDDCYSPYLIDGFNELYQMKKIRENLRVQFRAVEEIITNVLTNGYPKRLEFKSVQQWSDESEETRGRPSKIDSEFVKMRVQELVDKALNKEPGYKKYWHFDGRYKDRPVKNQLKKTIIEELDVDVDDSTVLRHIGDAISELKL